MNNEKRLDFLKFLFLCLVDDLAHRTGVKINIPPIQANNETIFITGEREGVDAAVAEINHIYQEKVWNFILLFFAKI